MSVSPSCKIEFNPKRSFLFLKAGLTEAFLSFSVDLVLYCEAFLTTYRTFITPEELIKKLQYRYPFKCGSSPAAGIRAEKSLWREKVASFLVKSLLRMWSVICLPWRCPRQDFLEWEVLLGRSRQDQILP